MQFNMSLIFTVTHVKVSCRIELSCTANKNKVCVAATNAAIHFHTAREKGKVKWKIVNSEMSARDTIMTDGNIEKRKLQCKRA